MSKFKPSIEKLEDRQLLAGNILDLCVPLEEARTIDGSDNNVVNPDWGSAETQLIRETTVEYGDGISSLAGPNRPSAREISNYISDQPESVTNDRNLTDFVWQWGQFIDHDIDLTHGANPAEDASIEVPLGDPYFDPFNTGTQTIGLNRSNYDVTTGITDPRQQINSITSFVDGSMVYGSDEVRAAALRSFEGGRLATSEGDLLPYNEDGLDNAGGPSDTLFLAGDVRANEQAGLTAMHTLFVREHNLQADKISASHDDLTDEEIYQKARAIVIAEIQAITYNEYLPALLGKKALSKYEGYDPSVNPSISNVFSTAAYRFGHSMLSPNLLRVNEYGTTADEGDLPLRDAFFNPNAISDNDIDSLLRGLASQTAQEIDTLVIDDVRNFLFGPPGSGGFDLESLNIQRGRDHGLADYNQTRIDFGLEPVVNFSDITSDPELAMKLEVLYGDVNDVDVWVGGLAEDHVRGSSMGELFSVIIIDQFERLRDGDRFWYENTFSKHQVKEIDRTSLSDIIQRNSDVSNIQDNVFIADKHANKLGLKDLSELVNNFGEYVTPETYHLDFNHDGEINLADLSLLVNNFGLENVEATQPTTNEHQTHELEFKVTPIVFGLSGIDLSGNFAKLPENHNFKDGDLVVYEGINIPDVGDIGLVNGESYFIHVIDADEISFHTSFADAKSDTDRVDINPISSPSHQLIVRVGHYHGRNDNLDTVFSRFGL